MISYLLATKHNIRYSLDTIDSILSLPNHDKEIIICGPEEVLEDDNRFRWVLDDKCTGSPYAFNKAYWASQGDYIATVVDDIILPSNFLDMLDFMNSDFMRQKKFKMSNTMWDGGPGLFNYGHDDVVDGENMWTIDKCHPVNINKCPYNVIPLPFFKRDTIKTYLSNHLFHPSFKNHFIDHWLGFYVSKNETYAPQKWRCPSIRYSMSQNKKPTITTDDNHDSHILRCLTDTFIRNETSYV